MLERENYYIKHYKPEYNRSHLSEERGALQTAGSSIGRKLTQKEKERMSAYQPNSKKLKVLDLKTNTTTVYNSTNSAAKSLNMHEISEYFNRIKNGSTKPFKGRFKRVSSEDLARYSEKLVTKSRTV